MVSTFQLVKASPYDGASWPLMRCAAAALSDRVCRHRIVKALSQLRVLALSLL